MTKHTNSPTENYPDIENQNKENPVNGMRKRDT